MRPVTRDLRGHDALVGPEVAVEVPHHGAEAIRGVARAELRARRVPDLFVLAGGEVREDVGGQCLRIRLRAEQDHAHGGDRNQEQRDGEEKQTVHHGPS